MVPELKKKHSGGNFLGKTLATRIPKVLGSNLIREVANWTAFLSLLPSDFRQ
jgi:hypothetical protein